MRCHMDEVSRIRAILAWRFQLEMFKQWLQQNSVSLATLSGATRDFAATVVVTHGRIAGQVAPASTDLDRIITWRSDKG